MSLAPAYFAVEFRKPKVVANTQAHVAKLGLSDYYGIAEGAWKHFAAVWGVDFEWIKGRYSSPAMMTKSGLTVSRWIDGVLRDELGFDGVVISDDLEMGAIRDHFTLKQTVTMAVRAGMDVLLFSNTAKYRASLGQEILDILLAEAEADPAFAARIEESYERIVKLKGRIR